MKTNKDNIINIVKDKSKKPKNKGKNRNIS